jgi:hypothetical protein
MRLNLKLIKANLRQWARQDRRHHYFGKNSSGIRAEVHADNQNIDLKLANLTVQQARTILRLVKEFNQ